MGRNRWQAKERRKRTEERRGLGVQEKIVVMMDIAWQWALLLTTSRGNPANAIGVA